MDSDCYSKTFFTTMTGKQFCCQSFFATTDDEHKFSIFSHHSSLYEGIRYDVQAFLNENWEKWKEEKPSWFDDYHLSLVPQSYSLPSSEKMEKVRTGKELHIRSKIEKSMRSAKKLGEEQLHVVH